MCQTTPIEARVNKILLVRKSLNADNEVKEYAKPKKRERLKLGYVTLIRNYNKHLCTTLML